MTKHAKGILYNILNKSGNHLGFLSGSIHRVPRKQLSYIHPSQIDSADSATHIYTEILPNIVRSHEGSPRRAAIPGQGPANRWQREMLQKGLDRDPSPAFDDFIAARAIDRGKGIFALETQETRNKAFDKSGYDQEIKKAKDEKHRREHEEDDNPPECIEGYLSARIPPDKLTPWINGNIQRKEILTEHSSPLMIARNKCWQLRDMAMAATMNEDLRVSQASDEPRLGYYTVGYDHIIGDYPYPLLSVLEDYGWRFEQVSMEDAPEDEVEAEKVGKPGIFHDKTDKCTVRPEGAAFGI